MHGRFLRVLPAAALVVGALASDAAAQNRDATSHVLRRTSFGPRAGEVDLYSQNYPSDLYVHLVGQLIGALPESSDFDQGLADFGVPNDPTLNPYANTWSVDDLARQNLFRAVWSVNQLRELMTLFWHLTLSTNYWSIVSYLEQEAATYLGGIPGTTNNQKARLAAARIIQRENDAFRANALGTYRDVLEASAKGPAMLIYLDSVENDDGTNENYARELLELHTLGTGLLHGFEFMYDYNPDIVQLAKAFSGWTIQIDSSQGWDEFEFTYDAANAVDADPVPLFARHTVTAGWPTRGPFTLAGVPTGQAQGEAILDYLADSYETRIWICSRLIEFFVGYAPMHPLDPIAPPTPQRKIPLPAGISEAQLTQLLYECLLAWGPGAQGVLDEGNIPAVLATIFISAPFNAPDARWSIIRNPFEYEAYLLRSFNVDIPRDNFGTLNPRQALTRANNALNRDLGMSLFRFPSPDGFPIHSEEVLSTSQYLYETNFAQSVIADFRLVDPTGLWGGYVQGELNWDPLGFCLPSQFKGLDFLTQITNLSNYLTSYPPPAGGLLDIGDKAALVGHVNEALFSSDLTPGSLALSQSWLAGWESTLLGFGQAPAGMQHLTFVVLLSNPALSQIWPQIFAIWGQGMTGFMTYMASVPQAHYK